MSVLEAIGFIGLGAMGAPMARNLLKAGIPVVACDIDPVKGEAIAALGAQVADCPAEVARRASQIICMVETTAQVRDVVAGPRGILEGATAGHRIACMSTIAPQEIKRLHDELSAHGIGFIDAPVSGGTERSIAGTLAIYASGDPAVCDAFDQAFNAMGEHVFRMGSIGQGTAMKLVNNMLIQVNAVAVAEAMALGAKAGLDGQQMYDIIKVSTGYSVAFEMRAPRMIQRNFKPGGTMDISYKDQELETAFGKELGVPLFLAAVSQQVYQLGRNMGYAKEDGSALIKVYERLSGLPSPEDRHDATDPSGRPETTTG